MFECRESGSILAEWFSLRSFMRFQSRCLWGLQSSEYLTGAGESTSNRLIHMAVALSHHVLLSSQHASRFPPEQVTQESQSHSVFYDTDMERAWYHFCTVLLVISSRLDRVWEGTTWVWVPRSKDHWGTSCWLMNSGSVGTKW